ncbi:MAG: molybdopterin-synthase adenylyltransferase MoeB [Gammaproteobacteria bacterium]|nr:molybdopterin-synthase adenylyltransferase MoeB [Gammaproteobacteria bacterium]
MTSRICRVLRSLAARPDGRLTLDDAQLLRYSRQIMLPELDIGGQEALLEARVLVVGLGGLGSPLALYLTAAGIGHLALVDDDRVDASNLQRQILHGQADIHRAKTASAADRLRALNPAVELTLLEGRLEGGTLDTAVAGADLIVDGTDNLATRYALNRACLKHRKPWVSAAAIRFEAQITCFDPRRDDSPCYRCLWPDAEDLALNCAENGVIAPLVGSIGALQALEAIKLIAGIGEPLVGRILTFDALSCRWQEFRLRRRADCADCGEVSLRKN